MPVRARDQIGGRLGNVIGIARRKRILLAVGQLLVNAVGLVGGGDDDALDAGPAASLHHRPGAADVRLKGRHRIAVGDAHDRLGRQMEHRIDLVLAQDALYQRRVADVAEDDVDALLGALDQERRG